jgi:predicted dehydrogenase
MATTLEECEAMVKAARESGRRLMIGHNQRYAPAHQKAKALIESGEIGRVLTFMTTFGHSGPEIWTGTANSWFFDKNRAAFGALADLGIHKADLIHYLTATRSWNPSRCWARWTRKPRTARPSPWTTTRFASCG